MPGITWTQEELDEFNQLTYDSCSGCQVTRIDGRMKMNEFVQTHGKEKCDAMWEHLTKGGE